MRTSANVHDRIPATLPPEATSPGSPTSILIRAACWLPFPAELMLHIVKPVAMPIAGADLAAIALHLVPADRCRSVDTPDAYQCYASQCIVQFPMMRVRFAVIVGL